MFTWGCIKAIKDILWDNAERRHKKDKEVEQYKSGVKVNM